MHDIAEAVVLTVLLRRIVEHPDFNLKWLDDNTKQMTEVFGEEAVRTLLKFLRLDWTSYLKSGVLP